MDVWFGRSDAEVTLSHCDKAGTEPSVKFSISVHSKPRPWSGGF